MNIHWAFFVEKLEFSSEDKKIEIWMAGLLEGGCCWLKEKCELMGFFDNYSGYV